MKKASNNYSKFTVEDIETLKGLKQQEIDLQKERIAKRAHLIFAPIGPATSKAESLMRSFNTGMAIFDGVMLGLKTIGRVRNAFKRKK